MRLVDIDNIGIGKANRDLFNVPEYADGWNEAIKITKSTPIAFDVEKVVEQLEAELYRGMDSLDPVLISFNFGINKAIEIVKKGGIR